MSGSSIKYKIKLTRKQKRKWESLKQDIPESLEKCQKFLEETPLDRLKSSGKLKKLKGKLDGILQYDVTDKARVWYTVDSQNQIVYIKYVGPHP